MDNMRRIKVCHVTNADMTLKFMLFDQLKFLQKRGYEVSTVSTPGKWVESIQNQGIKTKTIKMTRKISPFSDIALFVKLFFYFKREKFDIVHTHTFKPDFYGVIAAELAGTPIIIRTSHGFPFGEKSNFFKKKIYIFLEKFATKYSDLFLSISQDIIKTSIKENIARPDKIHYLGRDIDIDRFNPQKFSQDFILNKKKKLGIPLDKKIVGIVARLVEEKGYPELFLAFKQVVKKNPDAVLLAIGPKESEKKDAIDVNSVFQYGIEKQVMFLGERDDVEEIYPLMDVFVLPTRMEGLGASILEASAMEIPVIATNTGGCSETIDDGKTGILTPIKNSEKLADAINFILQNPDKARLMGKEGRKKVISEFSTEIILKRLGREYEEIIERRLKSFDKRWLLKYNQAAKVTGAKEHEISYWSERGFKNYLRYFSNYFCAYEKNKEENSKIKVLDVGCGPGAFLRVLSKKGFKVFGVDYSEDIMNMAKTNPLNKGIEFTVGDIYSLPYQDNFFDIVICSGVLQCISDVEKALSEIKRVLKPGGAVMIMTLNRLSITRIMQKEELKRYNPYGLRKKMAEYGFYNLKIKGVYFFPGFLDFLIDFMLRFKIYDFLNSFFPIFMLFSHSFYIEGKKYANSKNS